MNKPNPFYPYDCADSNNWENYDNGVLVRHIEKYPEPEKPCGVEMHDYTKDIMNETDFYWFIEKYFGPDVLKSYISISINNSTTNSINMIFADDNNSNNGDSLRFKNEQYLLIYNDSDNKLTINLDSVFPLIIKDDNPILTIESKKFIEICAKRVDFSYGGTLFKEICESNYAFCYAITYTMF